MCANNASVHVDDLLVRAIRYTIYIQRNGAILYTLTFDQKFSWKTYVRSHLK